MPGPLVTQAELPGIPQVRIWGDSDPVALQEFLAAELPGLEAKYRARLAKGEGLASNILAISGGADDGAFGAGVLVGWGELGNRPQFDLVTGISAGALIAPLIFVGSDADARLASVFTTHDSSQIYEANILSGIFGGEALADSGPLARLIGAYVDAQFLERIAEERAKGRLLIIGTTNIDAQRPVFWDIGKIAGSNHPDALQIVRKVLLASASIPGVFPPVRFDVTAGGRTYQELHVDGGATRQLFLSPSDFSFKALDRKIGAKVKRTLYIIRNGKLSAEYAPTKETALAIAQRSLETMIKSQSNGDLLRIYSKCQLDKIDYNLVSIPEGFSAPRPEPFSPSYMRPLYDMGYQTAKSGIPWLKQPPGIGGG